MAPEDDKKPAHAQEAAAALERARRLLAAPGPLDEKTRAEVLAALKDLAKAIEPALETRAAEARSVTHYAEAVAHEATLPKPSQSLLGTALEGLEQSAERLEVNHPTVAGVVERINQALAQIGI